MMLRWIAWMVLLTPLPLQGAETIQVARPLSPPAWALLERSLLEANAQACQEFFDRYFDERGYLLCVERWGGDDGPDDAIENCNDWPLLHALGGPDVIRRLVDRAWEGHLRQYTSAKTVEVPLAREGMYFREFPTQMDWLHNAEGLSVFNLMGLSDPNHLPTRDRMRRFAGLYLNEHPLAQNYDFEHRLIRSLFNGSRGPLLRPATALDWAGDPIEIEGRFQPRHRERTFAEMLAHFAEYNDIIGDHPQNLLATTLALNAFMIDGEAKYRTWLLDYVDAWSERTRANNGVIPSNIGLDGRIGGATGGKWYGGVYGWGFTVTDPVDGKKVHRTTVPRCITGFGNAFLLTGDRKYLEPWRGTLDRVNAQARDVEGRKMYPRMFGDQGWYAFESTPLNLGALELFYWSLDPADRPRVGANVWLDYLSGANQTYPERVLRGDLERVRNRVEAMREDPTTPDTRLSDDPMIYNPCAVDSLVHLMWGGIHTKRHGSVVHVALRYFDPLNRRAGIPDDVAALVDTVADDRVAVTLVNCHQLEPRTMIVQCGGYGEHEATRVTVGERTVDVNGTHFQVTLAPGAGDRLVIERRRYVNPPTIRFPWDRR